MTKLHRVCSITVLLLAAIGSAVQTKYFPDHIFDSDAGLNKFSNDGYSVQLSALHEPSLLTKSEDLSAQSYRFLWLRTFHHPVAVRLDLRPDGTAMLTTKVGSGAGGYAPGHILTTISKVLTKKQTESFLHEIDVDNFWNLPSVPDEPRGNDGSQWMIEGVKSGKYHLATQWTPSRGPIHDLGATLVLELAGLTIPRSELY